MELLAKFKIMRQLDKYRGKKIIRYAPTVNDDWSFTTSPVIFKGFTLKGEIVCCYIKENCANHYNYDFILLPEFTDTNWMPYEDIFIPCDDIPLTSWVGKKVKRIYIDELKRFDEQEFEINDSIEYPTLACVSKYHVVLNLNGKLFIFCDQQSNNYLWALAE